MRFVFAFVAALALVIVGCSNETEGEAKPHACAGVFGGTWHVTSGKGVAGVEGVKTCADAPASLDLTFVIQDDLSKISVELPDGAAGVLQINSTQIANACDYLGASISEPGDTTTDVTSLEVLGVRGSPDELSNVRFTLARFDSAELEADAENATPQCATAYIATMAR